jgi:VCBS repeat-containing protein
VTADGTVVDGAWGTLVINRNGSYTYTPDATAASVGQTDSFQYTLLDASDGETETATLTITIGSPDVTAPPVAAADTDVALINYANVTSTVAPAEEFTFNTAAAVLGPRTGSGNDTFTVAAGTTADITISAVRGATLVNLFPTYTITVRNAAGTVVGTISQTALAGLLGGPSVTLRLEDLPSGTYSYTVSSTNTVGTGYATSVRLGEEITFLNQFQVSSTVAAEGNLLANDTSGSDFATLRVRSGGAFVPIGDTPVTIAGTYGSLTVDVDGNYTYQPNSTLGYSTSDLVDSFTYQIVQPGGAVATSTLNVTLDVPGDGRLPTVATLAEPVLLDEAALARLAEDPSAAPADGATLDPDQVFSLFQGQGELEAVLARYLEAQEAEQGLAPALAKSDADQPVTVDAAADPVDPLAYLALPEDPERQGTASHPVL